MADTTSSNGLHHLRWFAESLMRDAELPDRQVTVMHRDLFRRAGIEWRDGQDLVELLASLDLQQLRGLIGQLRDANGEED
ncbi:hypothetical protein [Stenotrophomonas muris]|uniref:hypothetical protein n=1 Tax=Stenotrophomonas muris TaxID=2963283 RepID=UPI0039C608F7